MTDLYFISIGKTWAETYAILAGNVISYLLYSFSIVVFEKLGHHVIVYWNWLDFGGNVSCAFWRWSYVCADVEYQFKFLSLLALSWIVQYDIRCVWTIIILNQSLKSLIIRKSPSLLLKDLTTTDRMNLLFISTIFGSNFLNILSPDILTQLHTKQYTIIQCLLLYLLITSLNLVH